MKLVSLNNRASSPPHSFLSLEVLNLNFKWVLRGKGDTIAVELKRQRIQRLLFQAVLIQSSITAAAVAINKSQQLTNCKAPTLALIQQPVQHIELQTLQYPPACVHTSLISISSSSKSTRLIKGSGGWMAFFESAKTNDTPEEEWKRGVSPLPWQIWIKSTYCRIKVSAINISS